MPAAVSVAAVVAQDDDITLLIDNAGVPNGTPVVDGPTDDVRADLETKLAGLRHVAHAAAGAGVGRAPPGIR